MRPFQEMVRVFLTGLVCCLLVAPAQASTIRFSSDSKVGDSYFFEAAPGERNAIVIEAGGDGFRLTDAVGAPTGDCTPETTTTVLCPLGAELIVSAGDGDDSVLDRSGRLAHAYGGPGDDRLQTTTRAHFTGDQGDDRLVGGPGDDRLDGGSGKDRLIGGTGTDHFVLDGDGARPSRDVVDGGPGSDTAHYDLRWKPLRIDLARDRGPDGDVLRGIEHADGGRGNDVLIGDGQRNRLITGGGADRVDGRGGDDLITHEDGGAATLIGGPGNDQFSVSTSSPEVRCGAGRDRVFEDYASTTSLHADCERAIGPGPMLDLRRGLLTATWDKGWAKPCRLRVSVNGQPVPAGRAVPVQRPATVRLRPSGNCGKDWETPGDRASFRLL